MVYAKASINNSPSEKKNRFVADCAVSHIVLKCFDARNIGGTGYFQNTCPLDQNASRKRSTRLGGPLKELNIKVSIRTKRYYVYSILHCITP